MWTEFDAFRAGHAGFALGKSWTAGEGTGGRFTVRREPAGTGSQSMPIDSIALLETNTPERVISLAAGVLSGLKTAFWVSRFRIGGTR